ncbi:hypothetical protein GBF38_015610 [Nibea albiflora]|uniref:Uncharacterized protein n=1 Tax=Nibea albiflora TaxID=240163 RepID=A0ACB7EL99_NIBAL|nr:hypothetical protein GBF38_015610 [Nibea albiflora]
MKVNLMLSLEQKKHGGDLNPVYVRQEATFGLDDVLIVGSRCSCGNTVGFSHIELECPEF